MFRYVYWADWGFPSRIERADMSGLHRKTLVSRDLSTPNGLVLDLSNRKMYWTDSTLDKVSNTKRFLVS